MRDDVVMPQMMFEQMAIEVIQACSSASKLLGLDWDATYGIMKRAVQRGLSRRDTDSIEQIGIDSGNTFEVRLR
jgi:hypothetical protein